MRALRAIRAAYSPDGVNLGVNIGRAAGAGVPTHLHVHVLPRWSGDTNFMTTVAERPGDARRSAHRLRQAAGGLARVASPPWPTTTRTTTDDEGDALPKDLDVTAYVGPYVFPDIRRRRIAAACYVVIGAGSLWAGHRRRQPRARVRRRAPAR